MRWLLLFLFAGCSADGSLRPADAAPPDLTVASEGGNLADLAIAPALDLAEPDLAAPNEPDLSATVDAALSDMALPPSPSPDADVDEGDLGAGVEASGVANSAVTARVTVTAPGAVSAIVSFGPNPAYGHSTPSFPVIDGTVEVPLLGLTAAATTHFRAVASYASGPDVSSGDRTVNTPAPPFPLPSFTVTGSAAVGGYLIISAGRGSNTDGVSLLVDRTGHIMWYRVFSPWTTRGFDSQRLSNGRISVFQGTGWTFEEVDIAGRVQRQWTSPAPLGADGHEMLLLPNDHALIFGTTQHTLGNGTNVLGARVEELTPDGGTAFSWDSEAEIGLDETTPDINLNANPVDALHPNALAVAPDGNILASFRHLDTIVKIDRNANHILWRLGGSKSDFTFVNDPLNGFSHQHDVRVLENGDITVLDNGNSHNPSRTRVVEYQLDEVGKTATLVWSYTHSPPIFSLAAGSARRLPNGHTVVTWAIQGMVTEIDQSSDVVWEMSTTGWTIYRSVPVATAYP